MSLRKRTINGVFWTIVQQACVQGVNFVVQIILARILLPEAFGILAILQIFVSISTSIMDGGMTSSLIRTKNPDQKDYSTVFYMNLIFSIILYLMFFLSATYISSFFELPPLTDIIRVYTLSLVIQALVGVQTTKLTKEMNFKLQMYMQVPAVICGGVVGIFLAVWGYGVWSLVWMNLVSTTVFMAQHWIRSNWKPSFIIAYDRLKYHFNFGYKITLSTLLTSIYTNSFSLIIGKFFSVSQLGFYSQADTIRMVPVSNLSRALLKVTYPVFATLQDEEARLRSIFKKITQLVFFVIAPVMIVLSVVAEPLFKIILGTKWLPSVPYFQILAISAIVYPYSIYNMNIILAKGRSDLHVKLEVLKKGVSAIFLLLIFPFGLYGIVVAAAMGMLFDSIVNSLFAGKLLKYSIMKQLMDILPILLIGVTSAIVTLGIRILLLRFEVNDLIQLAVLSGFYLLIYILFSLYFKIASIYELKAFFEILRIRLLRKN